MSFYFNNSNIIWFTKRALVFTSTRVPFTVFHPKKPIFLNFESHVTHALFMLFNEITAFFLSAFHYAEKVRISTSKIKSPQTQLTIHLSLSSFQDTHNRLYISASLLSFLGAHLLLQDSTQTRYFVNFPFSFMFY